IHGTRLHGTTGNSQHAAVFIAMVLPALCYLVGSAREPKLWRVLFAAAMGFLCILLLWTGSRTGLLMATTAVLVFFRARLRGFVAVSLFVGLFVMLALQVYSESTLSVADMFSRGD